VCPPSAGFCSKCRVAHCTIARASGRWISAKIGSEGSQITCAGRSPPFVLRNCPSGRVSGPSRRPSSDPHWSGKRQMVRSVNATRLAVPMNEGRRTTIAGELRTLRANPGGDPSTNRPTRPPNSRDCAVCDAEFRTKTSRSGQPFAFLITQFFLGCRFGIRTDSVEGRIRTDSGGFREVSAPETNP